jgi:hypothetical protein
MSPNGDAFGISALGWNHVLNDITYRPAASESGAKLQEDVPFQVLP